MTKQLYPLVMVAVLLATAALFLPSLRGGFVSMDDEGYVVTNGHIRSLDGGTVVWAFSSVHMYNYHPLTMLSYAVDHAVWGLDPFGYHLTNLLLHIVNVLLVMLLVARLSALATPDAEGIIPQRSHVIAVLTGLLFAIHPLRVESVAWISERKDLLFGCFYLLAIVAYLRSTEKNAPAGRIVTYSLSLLSFALSALSKPMAVSLPVVLLILDIFPLRRLAFGTQRTIVAKRLIEKAPFVLVSVLIGIATLLAQDTSGEIRTVADLSLAGRFLIAMRALWFYLLKFLWPAGLAPFYPLAVPVRFSGSDAVGLLCLAGFTAWTVRRWRRGEPLWLAAWAFYVVMLSPTLGFIQVGGHAAADRYTYLPLLGPSILVAAGIALAGERLSRTGKYGMLAGVFTIVIVVPFSTFAFVSYRQMGIWKDSVSLWSREISVFPFEASISYYARGQAYAKKGELVRAEADFSLAVQLDPADFRSWSARGLVRAARGQAGAACADLRQALAIRPDYYEALYYLRTLCR